MCCYYYSSLACFMEVSIIPYSLLLQIVKTHVKEHGLPAEHKITIAYKKNEGRLFGGQFLDGIVNAIDAISMIRYTVFQPICPN